MFQPGGNHFLIRLPFVEGRNFIFLFQENADSPSHPADSLERGFNLTQFNPVAPVLNLEIPARMII